jgi:hypothetical protein
MILLEAFHSCNSPAQYCPDGCLINDDESLAQFGGKASLSINDVRRILILDFVVEQCRKRDVYRL